MDEKPNFFSERGQSLIIIALIMVALIAMLALVLDGGNTYFQRRNAQNAADAAALAGANSYCKDNSESLAQTVAGNYADLNDHFTLKDFSVDDTPTRVISVTTTKTFDTFFGGVIGWPQMTVEASASASCCNLSAYTYVLPVAWACHRPSQFNSVPSDSDTCIVQFTDEDFLNQCIKGVGNPPTGCRNYDYQKADGTYYPFYNTLYIMMDSTDVPDDTSQLCYPNGDIICDLDGDGESDIFAGGDRSWLDLDGGGGGSSELVSWMNGGWNKEIDVPLWVGGQSGNLTNVYHNATNLEGKIVVVPIYDALCDVEPDPNSSHCPNNSDPVVTPPPAGGNYYYHLVDFAAFYISCVYDNVQDNCPGHNYLTDNLVPLKLDKVFQPQSTKTIEGYFLDINLNGNQESNCTGTGIDFGSFVTRLTR